MVSRRWMAAIVLVLVAVTFGIVTYRTLRWKRFNVVTDGVLYRSGLLSSKQLESAIQKYGIKTVFSLTFDESDKERALCESLGVERISGLLPGDGVGPEDPYLLFLEYARDSTKHPILVHCSAGVQRTGGAVALYRSVIEGVEFDHAIEEMVDHGNAGESEQIELLRRIHSRLTSSPKCLTAPTNVARRRSTSTRID